MVFITVVEGKLGQIVEVRAMDSLLGKLFSHVAGYTGIKKRTKPATFDVVITIFTQQHEGHWCKPKKRWGEVAESHRIM